ncbi:MAG: helix-hairpin-helix domain-containing protein [Acidobacteriaceae bacterium]|jgi:DNA uptake protein ComE-like DNA-binding protein
MAELWGLRVGWIRAAVLGGLLFASFGWFVSAAQTVSTPPPQTIVEKIAASKGLLDINTATAEQLKALPGMGDAYVQRIVTGRPYAAKNQLATRGILPSAEYERIRELIIAHRVKPK